MPPRCSICDHPSRVEIDSALANPDRPLRSIARQYDLIHTTLNRHKLNCIGKGLLKLREARDEVVAVQKIESATAYRNAVAEQVENGQLLAAVTVEREIAKLFERVNKLYDACDGYLENPQLPGTYVLDARASEIRIVWEEVTEESADSPKPVWVKKTGTLQEALALAFSNGHRRLVRTNPIRYSDPRELILKAAGELRQTVDLLAKLEGRYRPVEKELHQGDTIQLSLVVNVLAANGFKV